MIGGSTRTRFARAEPSVSRRRRFAPRRGASSSRRVGGVRTRGGVWLRGSRRQERRRLQSIGDGGSQRRRRAPKSLLPRQPEEFAAGPAHQAAVETCSRLRRHWPAQRPRAEQAADGRALRCGYARGPQADECPQAEQKQSSLHGPGPRNRSSNKGFYPFLALPGNLPLCFCALVVFPGAFSRHLAFKRRR